MTIPTKSIFSLHFLILISRQGFCLQTGDITCMCYRSVYMSCKKSDLLYIFGILFTLFLFVHVAMEQALFHVVNHLISEILWRHIFKQLLFCFILLPFLHLPAPRNNKTCDIRSTLIQIWKSPYMFLLIEKQ